LRSMTLTFSPWRLEQVPLPPSLPPFPPPSRPPFCLAHRASWKNFLVERPSPVELAPERGREGGREGGVRELQEHMTSKMVYKRK
jgi:hypothetical protein